jgi:4-aminobutyrate aminotransferase
LQLRGIKFCNDDNNPEIDSIKKLLQENKVAFILIEIIQGEGG